MNLLWRVAFRVAHRVRLLYWFLVRPRGKGAYAAVWCRGQILLVRNSYRKGYTLPCGAVGRGESAGAAARRELREEAGIELAQSDLIEAAEFSTNVEYLRDRCTVFEAECAEEPSLGVDDREVVWAEFVPFEEARALPVTDIVRQYFSWREGEAPAEPNAAAGSPLQ